MIKIISKHTLKPVETICNDSEFGIDEDYIYSKDEFGQVVKWHRDYYYAKKKLTIKA